MGPFQATSMQGVRFQDLTIRLGQPYLYVHQGNCEHLLVFSDLRFVVLCWCVSFTVLGNISPSNMFVVVYGYSSLAPIAVITKAVIILCCNIFQLIESVERLFRLHFLLQL